MLTPHNPERCFTGKFGDNWILQAPAEVDLTNDIVNRRAEVEREPVLHRGGHTSTAGLDLGPGLRFENGDGMPCVRKVKSS